MAYSANTDYKALQDSLKKQLAAATDEATKSNLQAQINAADQSRIEKIASNLNTYGKYANDSELDSAAGIQATNQIGTGYETQKANLNRSYDQAIQNASNNALSRGMARSSFVQDRMANLDSDRATALSGIDAAKALAIQNAKANILSNYQDRQASNLAADKKEFANTINAYYNDFQQEINNVRDNGDTSDDWKIPYLQAARNKKLLDTYGTTDEAAIAAAKNAATGTKYTGGGGGGNDNGDGGDGGDGDNNNIIFNSGTPLPTTNIKASNSLVSGALAGVANAGAAQEIKQLRAKGYTTEQIKGIINGMNMSTAERNTYLKYLGS